MAGLNKIMLIGGLTKDVEVKYTNSGTAVATVNLATSEKWNDKKSGEQKEETQYHRIVFFNKSAETIGKFCSKGSQLYVEGKMKHRSYEQDGVTKYISEVHALSFQFLSKRQDHQGQPGNGFQQQAPAQGGFNQNNNQGSFQQQQGQFQVPPDDDIPF